MAQANPEDPDPQAPTSSEMFNYSFVVLIILLLLTAGATLAYYQNSEVFEDHAGSRWTPVVFLIGLCVSLLIFGLTRREAIAKLVLHQKTLDLIAAHKENEALLAAEQASRKLAEQANLAKDEFLAVVSHELKTPLNAIAGWNRILRTPGVSEETRQVALEKIDRNLHIQTAIVDELLSFSDIMSRSVNVDKRRIRMRDVFEDAVATVRVSAFQKGITLVDNDALDSEKVLADPTRLKMAIVNVLSNAVKFTPPGGRVEAKAFASDGCVRCVFTDTGIGISPESIRHIFERYRQSENASTRHYGGLGLGLTIAEHIIKLHDGTIEAASDGPGNGSKFTISIPSAS